MDEKKVNDELENSIVSGEEPVEEKAGEAEDSEAAEKVSGEAAEEADAAEESAEKPEEEGGEAFSEDDDTDDFDDFTAEEAPKEEEPEEQEETETEPEPEEPAMGEEIEVQEKKGEAAEKFKAAMAKLPWKWIGIAAGIIALLCVIGYFIGVFYYQSHFFNNTSLSNFDCSNMTVEEAEKKIREELDRYTFTLRERDGKKEVISGKDIDLVCVEINGIDKAKANQNPYAWFTDKAARNQPIEVKVNFDEDKLWHLAEGLECTAQSTMDMDGATAGVYYENGTYHMKEVENKNIISFTKLYTAMRAGIYGTYHDMSLEDEGIYVLMADEDHLKQAIGEMNKCVSANITYVKGDERYVVNNEMISNWVQLNPDYSVTLNDDLIADYVAELSTHYNTIGTWREFKASSGNVITVGGGDYGWQLDRGEEKEALKNNIRGGEVVEREPVYYKKAFEGFRGTSDIPSTYVEVSIGAQHMWYYKDGQLVVSSDCVTGIPNASRMTHTGVYYVKYKERNATLKGQGYESKVAYWMPFNGGEGLHDAPWRGAFGGSIYKSNGSHGCVNLPVGVAASLFSAISAGTPVIVY